MSIANDAPSQKPEDSNSLKVDESSALSFRDLWQKRLKVSKYYTADKVIFNLAMLLIFGFLWFTAHYYNYDLDSYECLGSPTDTCKNPFYRPASWKNQEFVLSGKYGTDLSAGPFNSAGLVSFLILLTAFVLNHLLYNRGRIKLKEIAEQMHDENDTHS